VPTPPPPPSFPWLVFAKKIFSNPRGKYHFKKFDTSLHIWGGGFEDLESIVIDAYYFKTRL
jgi:hypothetical protein